MFRIILNKFKNHIKETLVSRLSCQNRYMESDTENIKLLKIEIWKLHLRFFSLSSSLYISRLITSQHLFFLLNIIFLCLHNTMRSIKQIPMVGWLLPLLQKLLYETWNTMKLGKCGSWISVCMKLKNYLDNMVIITQKSL